MLRMAQQLGFEGMPRRLFSATPAKLSSYLDCPRRYRMTYLDRPAPPRSGGPWAHLSVGAALHLALRGWWLLPEERREPRALTTLIDSAWVPHGFKDSEQELAVKQRAVQWLANYAGQLVDVPEPIGVERTVAFRTQRLAFSGRADRIDLRSNVPGESQDDECDELATDSQEPSVHSAQELVIVDYKTGRTPSTDDDARGSAALALYAVAAQRTLRKPCVRVELHHVPTGRVASHTYTQQGLRRQVDRSEQLATEIDEATQALNDGADPAQAFPAQPSKLCGWCDFREHCPEGSKSTPRYEPWSGLPSDDLVV